MSFTMPKTLQIMVENILEDQEVLENKVFVNLLSAAADDWCSQASTLDKGNCAGYNCRRAKRMIDAIQITCFAVKVSLEKPVRSGFDRNTVNWHHMLSDIKMLTEICDFEFSHNVFQISPDYGNRINGIEKVYKIKPTTR